jgi:rod shape-determining protein MreD
VKYPLWATAVLLAFVLEAKVSILSIAPNLTVLLAYYAGMMYGETKGMTVGLIIGGLEDSLSSSIIGPNMLGKGLTGFFSASLLSGGVFVWTPLFGILGVALLTLIDNSVVFFSLSIFDRFPTSPASALLTTTMQAILNAGAGIVIRPPHED